MDGIIVVNKEKDLTSHQVVNIVRRALGTRRVGHVGTLDPLATGVLVVCVEGATKLSPFLMTDDKEYQTEIIVGIASDTEDITGTITEKMEVNSLSQEEVDQVLSTLVGDLEQLPPLYSAVKINGKKLYEYARANVEVDRKPRVITIKDIKRTSNIEIKDGLAKFSFWTHVSKGTYVRTLCTEIGKRLGYPALMSGLTRVRSGKFKIEQANTIEEIQNGTYKMISMLEALSDFDQIELDNKTEKLVLNGMKVPTNLVPSSADMIVFKQVGQLVGIYEKNNFNYKAVRIWKQYL